MVVCQQNVLTSASRLHEMALSCLVDNVVVVVLAAALLTRNVVKLTLYTSLISLWFLGWEGMEMRECDDVFDTHNDRHAFLRTSRQDNFRWEHDLKGDTAIV